MSAIPTDLEKWPFQKTYLSRTFSVGKALKNDQGLKIKKNTPSKPNPLLLMVRVILHGFWRMKGGISKGFWLLISPFNEG